MANYVTCDCGQSWAVVPTTLKAHPGYRTEPRTVVVPNEDIHGKFLGHVRTETSHWVTEGPSAILDRTLDDETIHYHWTCLCSRDLAWTQPHLYQVPCQYDARDGGVCAIARQRRASTSASAPQRAWACPCCGHQGSHWVAWNETAPCGASPQDLRP